jgi:hypothetical protein
MIFFENTTLPKFNRARRNWEASSLENPEKTVSAGMEKLKDRIRPGGEIAIAVGSRGIYNYARIVKAVADNVKRFGGIPVLVPAMGSHGGATAEGQTEVLRGYGVTEEYIGAAMRASMETVIIGQTHDGTPIHIDAIAYKLDGVILVNRIKQHTDFDAPIESGLCKQMVIGLGKQKGASAIHRHGTYGLQQLIPEAAQIIVKKAPIIMGVGILENFQDKTAKIAVVAAEAIVEEERILLAEAKALMPSLPCKDLDVLVLQEMGKNISGTGIDPNIVGRYLIRNVEDEKPGIYRIVCLDLTDASHHNAIGVGIADIISRRLYDKIDLQPTYMNTITSGGLQRGFIPLIAESDQEALIIAMNCCNRYVTEKNARIIFAKNTLELQNIVISEPLLDELRHVDDLEVLDEIDLQWDDRGGLVPLF